MSFMLARRQGTCGPGWLVKAVPTALLSEPDSKADYYLNVWMREQLVKLYY